MCWFDTFILLKQLYSIIIMTEIVIFCSTESMPDKTRLNYIQDLSAKIDDYNMDNKTMESHPLNEGFILLSDNHKKSSSITSTSNNSTIVNRTFTSYGISSTTCKSITVVETIQTPIEDGGEIGGFFKIDDEELINIGVTIDGSGDTIEPTSETTTMSNESVTSTTITTISSSTSTLLTSTISMTNSTSVPIEIILSGNSTFLITIDCINASAILNDILEQFNKTFPYSYDVSNSTIPVQCARSLDIEVSITFYTNNNITILNNLFQTLGNIVSKMEIELKSVDTCGIKEIVTVKNVTSCYLINLCSLCGINPRRGICLPENNISKCECFVNQNNLTISYIGEFCKIQQEKLITSVSSSWSPIIIGILAGIAGLFCAITSFVLVITFVRRHRFQKKNISPVNHLWYLPRAQIPTSVSIKSTHNYLNNSQTDSNYNRSNATDSLFFQELDRKMGRNLRARITRPNTQAMLASLPSGIISIRNSYDRINELDAIIDDEDISITFHEPIGLDNELFEMMNPNFKY